MNEDRTPFAEDVAAHQVAARLGFVLERRYRKIEILDEQAIVAAGYTSSRPRLDFGKLSAALDEGPVIGARFGPLEYTLRAKGGRS